ncbi:MAG: diacylglycerol kinase family protein [Myxococcota bacterium]
MAPVPADRVAVVVNGNARRVTEEIVGILDELVRSGDLFVSRSLDEGREIAARIVARGYATVLTGGGDGTFTQMVTWVTQEARAQGKEPPRFGLLKLGTGNALAWVLGSGKAHTAVADLARIRTEGGTRNLRLLDIEGTLAPFAGLGAGALALQHFEHVKARLGGVPGIGKHLTGGVSHAVAIVGRAVPDVLRQAPGEVRIVNRGAPATKLDADGQPTGIPFPTGAVIYGGTHRGVLASTIPYWGFGARIFPFANEREDRFHLRVVDIGSAAVARNLRGIWQGTYRDPKVHDVLVEHVEIQLGRPTPLEIGGDYVGDRERLEIRLSPEPVRVVDYYAPPPVS